MVTPNPQATGTTGGALSLRAYGRHRQELGLPGGNAVAVSRAIATERLKDSVVYLDGVAKIGDAARADIEWAKNTDLTRAPSAVKAKAAGVTEPPITPAAVTDGAVTPAAQPKLRGKKGNTLAEASTREKNARADLAELEYQEKAGHLVPASAVERAWSEMVSQMRTSVLSVPSKAKGLMPHLTYNDLAQLNELLCQALEGLAPGDQAKGAAA